MALALFHVPSGHGSWGHPYWTVLVWNVSTLEGSSGQRRSSPQTGQGSPQEDRVRVQALGLGGWGGRREEGGEEEGSEEERGTGGGWGGRWGGSCRRGFLSRRWVGGWDGGDGRLSGAEIPGPGWTRVTRGGILIPQQPTGVRVYFQRQQPTAGDPPGHGCSLGPRSDPGQRAPTRLAEALLSPATLSVPAWGF